MDFKPHYKHLFGTYVESHNKPTVTNNIGPRKYACIELGRLGNIQRPKKLFDIYTGKVLKFRKLIGFPMTYRLMHRMNASTGQ